MPLISFRLKRSFPVSRTPGLADKWDAGRIKQFLRVRMFQPVDRHVSLYYLISLEWLLPKSDVQKSADEPPTGLALISLGIERALRFRFQTHPLKTVNQ